MCDVLNKIHFLIAVDILLSDYTARDAPKPPISPNAFLIRELSPASQR